MSRAVSSRNDSISSGLSIVGLVVRERCHHQIWNAIACDHQDRMVLCFWNAATMKQDRAAAHAWHAGASERAAGAYAAVDRMFQPMHG